MLNDFKKFIMRGNFVELASAVLVGAAVGAVVNSLVKDVITPLISAIFGKHTDFSNLSLTIHGSKLAYGDFFNALISFAIIVTVVFFLVIQPVNKLKDLASRSKTTDDPTDKKCPECLSTIPIDAKRCAFCTTKLKTS